MIYSLYFCVDFAWIISLWIKTKATLRARTRPDPSVYDLQVIEVTYTIVTFTDMEKLVASSALSSGWQYWYFAYFFFLNNSLYYPFINAGYACFWNVSEMVDTFITARNTSISLFKCFKESKILLQEWCEKGLHVNHSENVQLFKSFL